MVLNDNYFQFSFRRRIVASFVLSLVSCAVCQIPATSVSKTKIAVTSSELEDLKHGKYTGGFDVDELYKPTTSSHLQRNASPPAASKVDRPSNEADIMLADSDPDNVIEDSATSVSKHDSSRYVYSSRRVTSNNAQAIAAGICLVVALASYVALMVWRNMTNAGYANRAMLLTDDDMGDIQDEDLRHFELRELNRELRIVPT